MTRTTSWTSLVLITSTILFPPFTTALPLPTINMNQPEPGRMGLQPRSPIPDPRMIPNKTDLLSNILARLGIDEFAQLNKLSPEQHDGQGQADNEVSVPIDDSQSNTPPVTSPSNQTDHGQEKGDVKADVKGEEQGEHGKTGEQGKDGKTEGQGKDGKTEGQGQDATKNPDGFVANLFKMLRERLQEAINASDEIRLR